MASAAMETTEDLEVQDAQEDRSWSEEIEQQVQQNANDGEPQENSLIAPSGDESDVPDAISKMMNNGVKFTQAKESWKIDNENVRVRKSYSVYFTLDTQVPVNKIFEALDGKGIDFDHILSVQRRLGSNTYVVSFSTAEAKSQILSSWDIEVCGYRAFVADCDHKISIVKIYNAPNEMPDSVLIGRLSVYGTVLSFRRDLVNDSVFNGIRTARMEIKHDIPSTVRIVGEFIKFWYPGQPKSCRRCGDLDHLIKDCVNIRCFNCEQSGHRVEQCPERPMCSICRSTSHPVRNCPYFLYSVNVERVSSSKNVSNSYAGAAKAPRTVAFTTTLSSASKTPENHNPKEKENRREKEVNESLRSYGRSQESHRERDRERERGREHYRERSRERGRERERRFRDRSHHHRHEHYYDEDRYESRDRRHRREESSTEEEDSSSSDEEEWTTVRKRNKHKRR